MRQQFLFLILLTFCSHTFSQSNLEIIFEKTKSIVLTKESLERIAKDGYNGKLVDQGNNSPSNFFETYQIPETDSIKNINFFTFDYDRNESITGLSFILREPVIYEKGSIEVNYRLFYGEPEIQRFNNEGKIIRFEFYHEISKLIDRYHFYMILEKIPNRDANGSSDGIIMWGWTTDKSEFMKQFSE
jgi:UDP-N-acetylglucosamine transferase subunit ALG13